MPLQFPEHTGSNLRRLVKLFKFIATWRLAEEVGPWFTATPLQITTIFFSYSNAVTPRPNCQFASDADVPISTTPPLNESLRGALD